jgi:hypothetical protein
MADQTSPCGTTKSLFTFVWVLLAVALSIGAWSLSTPLGAAPDEPQQMIQAAAAVRGQLHDQQFELQIAHKSVVRAGLVEIPQWVANVGNVAGCFSGHLNVPAGCAPSVGNNSTIVRSASAFSNYPRLYYLIVGVPSLLATGHRGLIGMQYASALLNAALISLGLFLLARYHPRRIVLLGALVALSPMVLFLSGVVNPSGMETAAAFASWCGGLCVVERVVIPRALAVLTSLAFVALILSRPTSPVNAAVIIVVLIVFAGWNHAWPMLSERSFRPVWISVTAAVFVAGFSLVLLGVPSEFGLPENPPLSFLGVLWLMLRWIGGQLRQCIGAFGSGETLAPNWVVAVWVVVLGGLLVYGLAVSRSGRRALSVLVLGMFGMLLIFEVPEINPVGFYWQGRYWLPLAVGLPLVASAVEPRSLYRRGRSAMASPGLRVAGFVGVGAILMVAQVGAFLTSLHRYETGLGVPAGSPIKWTPPGGTVLVVAAFVAGQALLLGFVTWQSLNERRVSSFLATGGRRSTVEGLPPVVPVEAASASGAADQGAPLFKTST